LKVAGTGGPANCRSLMRDDEPYAVSRRRSRRQRVILRGLTEKEAKELVRLLQNSVAAGDDLSRAPPRDAASPSQMASLVGTARHQNMPSN
jgi:hypothetical protein